MNFIEFVKNFPDEESGKRKWREIREIEEGFFTVDVEESDKGTLIMR